MTITETSVLITDDENVTDEDAVLACGREALGADRVTLVGTDGFGGCKAHHFRTGA